MIQSRYTRMLRYVYRILMNTHYNLERGYNNCFTRYLPHQMRLISKKYTIFDQR